MNVALRRTMTLEQFLAWEERQEARFEFDGIGPRAMTGGTAVHAAIQRNLITALSNQLRGKPCQPYGSELKIEVAGRIRYPDAFVVCSRVASKTTVVSDPVVVFEILSDSTASIDLNTKNAEYQATASIRRYVVLHQDAAACIIFSHRNDEWATDLLEGIDAVLTIPEIGVDIPLSELFYGIEFPPTSEG